jgi:methanogenic corrinoid protein MtbC1
MIGREPRVQPPLLDAYSDMPLFNTKAVVHHTGVPAPTLRAWERRYGILAPRRGENDYRLYSERDMMMVSWLRERVENGMTISQAIALLRSIEPARRRGRRLPPSSVLETPVTVLAPSRFAMDDLAAALLSQLSTLDESGAARTLAQALAIVSVEDVCLGLLTPVLVEIGRRWECHELPSTTEHFASGVIRAQLEDLLRTAASGASGPLVIVGCAPGEQHELGALMVALFLRRSGMRVAYLGQSVEPESLFKMIGTHKPAGVVLSAAMEPHALELARIGEHLRDVPAPRPALFFGGRAFVEHPELADHLRPYHLPGNARAAVEEIRRKLVA